MIMTSSQTTAQLAPSSYKMMVLIVFVFALGLISGCSQFVDQPAITGPGLPAAPPTTNRNLMFNADIAGTSILTPVSNSRAMTLNTVGATALRTVSSSSSLNMTSGIGIE